MIISLAMVEMTSWLGIILRDCLIIKVTTFSMGAQEMTRFTEPVVKTYLMAAQGRTT